MNQPPAASQTPTSAKARPKRAWRRYPLPASLAVEAHWDGRLLTRHALPGLENISGGGLCVSLAETTLPPVGARLEVKLPIISGLSRLVRISARCQARVLRHQPPSRIAMAFEKVRLVHEQRKSTLPGQDEQPDNPTED